MGSHADGHRVARACAQLTYPICLKPHDGPRRLAGSSLTRASILFEDALMITIASILVAAFIAFGVMAETSPVLDHLPDDL